MKAVEIYLLKSIKPLLTLKQVVKPINLQEVCQLSPVWLFPHGCVTSFNIIDLK